MLRLVTGILLSGVALNEGLAAKRLWDSRRENYLKAKERAAELQRPLLVIGDPNTGAITRMFPAAGCGDLCIDLSGCPGCPSGQVVDVTGGFPSLESNSAVVFISCVLEYIPNPNDVYAEALRVAGATENLYVVTVDPDSVTAFLYPGAQNRLRDGTWEPVKPMAKIVVGTTLVAAITGLVVRVVERK